MNYTIKYIINFLLFTVPNAIYCTIDVCIGLTCNINNITKNVDIIRAIYFVTVATVLLFIPFNVFNDAIKDIKYKVANAKNSNIVDVSNKSYEIYVKAYENNTNKDTNPNFIYISIRIISLSILAVNIASSITTIMK